MILKSMCNILKQNSINIEIIHTRFINTLINSMHRKHYNIIKPSDEYYRQIIETLKLYQDKCHHSILSHRKQKWLWTMALHFWSCYSDIHTVNNILYLIKMILFYTTNHNIYNQLSEYTLNNVKNSKPYWLCATLIKNIEQKDKNRNIFIEIIKNILFLVIKLTEYDNIFRNEFSFEQLLIILSNVFIILNKFNNFISTTQQNQILYYIIKIINIIMKHEETRITLVY